LGILNFLPPDAGLQTRVGSQRTEGGVFRFRPANGSAAVAEEFEAVVLHWRDRLLLAASRYFEFVDRVGGDEAIEPGVELADVGGRGHRLQHADGHVPKTFTNLADQRVLPGLYRRLGFSLSATLDTTLDTTLSATFFYQYVGHRFAHVDQLPAKFFVLNRTLQRVVQLPMFPFLAFMINHRANVAKELTPAPQVRRGQAPQMVCNVRQQTLELVHPRATLLEESEDPTEKKRPRRAPGWPRRSRAG